MVNPSGYTALDLVGFTDKGDYSASATYVANDLVHYGGSIWCCLIDDTVGITPTEGVNWRFWVENSQNGISDIVNVLGAKNLLKIGVEIPSLRGITVTDNRDGSITLDGTATEDAYFNIMRHDFGNLRFATDGSADNSEYKLSGLPVNSNFYIAYNPSNKFVTVVVKPAYGAVDNVTIYPMIRPKNIEDDTWQPYTKTNKELTEEVTQNSSDIQTLSNNVATNAADIQTLTNKDTVIESEISDMVNVLGSKNLLPNNITTQVINGVRFTVNSDGSISTSGTAVSDAFISMPVSLKKGTYTVTGTPAGGSTDTFLSGKSDLGIDTGNGTTWTLENDIITTFYITIKNGFNSNGLVFHPMIRPSSIVDDTYVPYAMANRELTKRAISNNFGTEVAVTSGTNYTCPSNGIIVFGSHVAVVARALVNSVPIESIIITSTLSVTPTRSVRVFKGDVVNVGVASGTLDKLVFIPTT